LRVGQTFEIIQQTINADGIEPQRLIIAWGEPGDNLWIASWAATVPVISAITG
jgi:hypothetical protein